MDCQYCNFTGTDAEVLEHVDMVHTDENGDLIEDTVVDLIANQQLDSSVEKMELLNKVWASVVSEEQQMRLINAINKYSMFSLVLEDYSYDTARDIMQGALSAGDIIQEDYDLVDGILPAS